MSIKQDTRSYSTMTHQFEAAKGMRRWKAAWMGVFTHIAEGNKPNTQLTEDEVSDIDGRIVIGGEKKGDVAIKLNYLLIGNRFVK